MKTQRISIITIIALLLPVLGGWHLLETYKTNTASSSMTIEGTSSLHDWSMDARNMNGVMDVDLFTESLRVNSLQLTIPVKELKSDKSAMDRNAYKALKADQHSEIKYRLLKVNSQQKTSASTFKLNTYGELTIAGKTRKANIPVDARVTGKSITLSGTATIKMTEYDVEPPSFMFGSVTTGNEVTVKFNINYKSTEK